MNHTYYPAFTNWHPHIHRYAAAVEMRDWLTGRNSLTARLVARCWQFRVQRLKQQVTPCFPEEFAVIGLPGRANVVERDVLLRCDDAAAVCAYTVFPLSVTANQWPLLGCQGDKSLGRTLFHDPLVTRGSLRYA